jgi:hypothetical protein
MMKACRLAVMCPGAVTAATCTVKSTAAGQVAVARPVRKYRRDGAPHLALAP